MAVTVVTKDNFSNLLPSILHHIKDAEFITFDTELTGLTTSPGSRYFYYDDPNDRYRKLKDSATSFGVLQFGLCAFKPNGSSSSNANATKSPSHSTYTTTAWSFHLFPGATSSGSTNDYRKWTLQLSSILFLRENGFDFNKTFLEGVSYLSRAEEADMRQRQAALVARSSGATASTHAEEVPLKDDDVLFLEDTVRIIQEWIDSEDPNKDKNPDKDKDRDKEALMINTTATASISKDDNQSLLLPPCNSFQRLILYQQLPKRFPEITVKKTTLPTTKETRLSVAFTDATQRQQAIEEETAAFETNLMELIGFRRLVDAILTKGCPLIGHNCWLDICHLYQKFIGPLPGDWSAFQSEWEQLGGGPVFDTKLLAAKAIAEGWIRLPEGSSSSLETLATMTDDRNAWGGVRVPIDGGKTRNKKQQFHDAGFDAYCTGKVFLGLAAVEANRKSTSLRIILDAWWKGDGDGCFGGVAEDNRNCLNMMQSDWDRGVNLLTCENVRQAPPRHHLLVLSNFNASYTSQQVMSFLTGAIGSAPADVQLYWRDSRTVFIALKNETLLDEVKAKVPLLIDTNSSSNNTNDNNGGNGNSNSSMSLMSWSQWSESLTESPSPSPSVKRSRPNSS